MATPVNVEKTSAPPDEAKIVEKINTAQIVAKLGELFLAAEGFMVEMRKKEAFHVLADDFADTMLTSRELLQKLGFEPLSTRRKEPLTYKHE